MVRTDKIKVLIVDDDEGFCSLIKSFLESRGITAESTLSARQALEMFNSDSHFDVVISDIRMDDMDGLELRQKIKHIDKDFPVILISGCVDIESMIEALGLKVEEYVPKPFKSIDEILNPIFRCVYKYRELNGRGEALLY